MKFHTKYLTHTLEDVILIQHWNLKSTENKELRCLVWNAPWWHKEPGHQQLWYWPSSPGIFRFQHHKDSFLYKNTYITLYNWVSYDFDNTQMSCKAMYQIQWIIDLQTSLNQRISAALISKITPRLTTVDTTIKIINTKTLIGNCHIISWSSHQ